LAPGMIGMNAENLVPPGFDSLTLQVVASHYTPLYNAI